MVISVAVGLFSLPQEAPKSLPSAVDAFLPVQVHVLGSAREYGRLHRSDRRWPADATQPSGRLIFVTIRIAVAQLNPTVGDLSGNADRIRAAMSNAETSGADLLVFPELVLTGYPPEDLLLKDGFIADQIALLEELAGESGECVSVIGAVVPAGYHGLQLAEPVDARSAGRTALGNAAVICHQGKIVDIVAKRLLPNYDVFDERRWFLPGGGPASLFRIAGELIGIAVCEDLWGTNGPAQELAHKGARIIASLNASPFSLGRAGEREEVLRARVQETSAAIVYVNQVGGQDELVFDGGSLLLHADGTLRERAPQFVEGLFLWDYSPEPLDESLSHSRLSAIQHLSHDTRAVRKSGVERNGWVTPGLGLEEEAYRALVLGTRDYLGKNGFTTAVIGLSGGVDSTLVAAIAADAIGPENVFGISMPSRYSSDHSKSDAKDLADRLGIEITTIPIEPAHVAYTDMLFDLLGHEPKGLTDENLQSRLRGMLLMAYSNDTGAIVLTTGNKSEMACGYSTLYGDSAGGFAVIKDLPKTLVFSMCEWLNADATASGKTPPIPANVITKPPSAELRPDQADTDSLPPYELLDPIIAGYVEDDLTATELITLGHDPDLVLHITRLIDLAEYKRRQNPPGVKITAKAFGRDRRMPITNRYRDSGQRVVTPKA